MDTPKTKFDPLTVPAKTLSLAREAAPLALPFLKTAAAKGLSLADVIALLNRPTN